MRSPKSKLRKSLKKSPRTKSPRTKSPRTKSPRNPKKSARTLKKSTRTLKKSAKTLKKSARTLKKSARTLKKSARTPKNKSEHYCIVKKGRSYRMNGPPGLEEEPEEPVEKKRRTPTSVDLLADIRRGINRNPMSSFQRISASNSPPPQNSPPQNSPPQNSPSGGFVRRHRPVSAQRRHATEAASNSLSTQFTGLTVGPPVDGLSNMFQSLRSPTSISPIPFSTSSASGLHRPSPTAPRPSPSAPRPSLT